MVKTIQSSEIFPSLYHSDLSSDPKWKPFLLLFIETALVWPSKETVIPSTDLLRTVSPGTPLSCPVKVLTGSCHYTQIQKRGHSDSTDTCWNSQFLPSSLIWPSLLLSNPKIYVIIFESLVVKAFLVKLLITLWHRNQKAARQSVPMHSVSWAGFFSLSSLSPPISDVSYSFLKGIPKESAFTLPRLSHRPLGKTTWKPQH